MKKLVAFILSLALVLTCVPLEKSYAATNPNYFTFYTTNVSLSEITMDSISSNPTDGHNYITLSLYDGYLNIEGETTIWEHTPKVCNIKLMGTDKATSTSRSGFYFTVTSTMNYAHFAKEIDLRKCSGTDANPDSKIYDYDTDRFVDGSYRLCIFSDGQYKNEIFLNATIVVRNGVPSLYSDINIIENNANCIGKLTNSFPQKHYFLDTTLSDVKFGLANVVSNTSAKGTALTATQTAYIKEKAQAITADSETDYDKIKAIYSFVASNLYYDKGRTTNTGTNPACSNPYINLKAIENGTTNGYNAEEGKVATNCVGYATMVAAMARSIGIPTVIVNGSHHNAEKRAWFTDDFSSKINTVNHHWNMCYVDDRWITVDANMGSGNAYDTSKAEQWTTKGITNYTFFDCTLEQLSHNYLLKGYYALQKVGAPTSASASLTGYRDVKITWGKAANASGYNVYYKKASETSYTKLTSTTGLTYSKKGLASGTKHTFKIVPYMTVGGVKYEGTASKTASVWTLKKLNTPTIVKSGTKVKVKWNNIEGETGYQISQSTKKTGTTIVSTYATTTGSSKLINATKGKTYYYKVRAYKVVGSTKIYGPWSAVKAYKR